MGAIFRQAKINIREVLNEIFGISYKTAENAKALLPLAGYTGKNILINGDKTINQREISIFSGSEYIYDRCEAEVNDHVVNVTSGYDSELKNFCKYTIGTAGSGSIGHRQKIENYEDFNGKLLTYTVMLRGNSESHITLSDGINSFSSIQSSSDGVANKLTVTMRIDNSATNIFCDVYSHTFVGVGVYISIGSEQLELGSEFTGFEIVPPVLQVANCKRYCHTLTTDSFSDPIGNFTSVSTTSLYNIESIIPMRIAQPTIQNGSSSMTSVLCAITGSMTHDTDSDATKGKVILKLTGSGLTAGQSNFVYKQDTSIIYLDAEM